MTAVSNFQLRDTIFCQVVRTRSSVFVTNLVPQEAPLANRPFSGPYPFACLILCISHALCVQVRLYMPFTCFFHAFYKMPQKCFSQHLEEVLKLLETLAPVGVAHRELTVWTVLADRPCAYEGFIEILLRAK